MKSIFFNIMCRNYLVTVIVTWNFLIVPPLHTVGFFNFLKFKITISILRHGCVFHISNYHDTSQLRIEISWNNKLQANLQQRPTNPVSKHLNTRQSMLSKFGRKWILRTWLCESPGCNKADWCEIKVAQS